MHEENSSTEVYSETQTTLSLHTLAKKLPFEFNNFSELEQIELFRLIIKSLESK
jgi:hypothetical protein